MRYSYMRSREDQKIEAYNCGQTILAKLEKIIDEDDNITRQFILRSRAILCKRDNIAGFEAQQKLLEAICLTVPRFDEEKIGSRLHNRIVTWNLLW